MFDADDRKMLISWLGVYLVVLSAVILFAIALGIAVFAFRLVGGL